jgi:hypothetical protein
VLLQRAFRSTLQAIVAAPAPLSGTTTTVIDRTTSVISTASVVASSDAENRVPSESLGDDANLLHLASDESRKLRRQAAQHLV